MVAKKEKARKTKQPKPVTEKDKTYIFTTGKRKRAVARATFRPGSGKVKINGIPVELIKPYMVQMRIREPLIIAGEGWEKFDIAVNVRGGGTSGQMDAAAQAIARGLYEIMGEDVKKKFLEYNRNLIVYDPRRTEPHKPPRSSQGPRRYKQRSKR